MTIHHEPAELPRPALSVPPQRPWSGREIAMAIAAGVLAVFALAILCLSWGGR